MRESPLDVLLLDGVIDEVVGRLNSGKEADIYLVQHRGRIVAAKVYRDRQQRSFKNNADYKEGRGVRNSRTQRAIDTGSRYGRQVSEDEWGTTEARALHLLEAHGVRVPVPVMSYEGVLLMELVVDAEGRPAPRLIEVAYDAAAARAAYVDLRGQIVRMLCAEIVHGDLSPYNILAAASGPTIIDFPQIVSAAHNSRAEFFFLRDYQNVHQFLAAADRSLASSYDDGRQIWNAYRRRELTPEFVPSAAKPRFVERRVEPAREARPYPPRDARPQNNAYPPRDARSQGNAYPPRDARPQSNAYPPRDSRPQSNAYPPRDARPQGAPNPPRNDARPQSNAYPPRDARPQGAPNPPRNDARPQGTPNPPRNDARPQGAASQAPPALRNVRERTKVYTSPDLPPRGAPKPEETPSQGGFQRRRPKRRF
jgi:RIO kinase 1